MAHIRCPELISHSQKVCSLYKKSLRSLNSWLAKYEDYRIEAVMMRARFDKNKNIKDLRYAKKLLIEGEEELFNCSEPSPFVFPTAPGGAGYGREVTIRDWIFDYWNPMEKACYPKYFAIREKRKKEFLEFFEKEYNGKKTT